MRASKLSTFAALISTTSIIAINSASAQSSDDANTKRLDSVTVTATRSAETDLQSTSIAVTAISGDELLTRNVQDLKDVASYVPSLSIGNRSGKGGSQGAVTLRGMGTDALDSSGAVGIYIDDVYYPSQFGNILGLMDVERVEVLRGPQGTLFGRNSIGGAIQYVSKRPGDEFGGYAKASFGNFERQDFSGAVDLPVSENLSFRLAGLSNSIDGYVRDDLNGIDRGATEDQIARLRALWTPTDKLTVDAKVEFARSENNGKTVLLTQYDNNAEFVALANSFNDLFMIPAPPFGFTPANISPSANPGDFSNSGFNDEDRAESETTIYQASIAYDISDNLTIKSITAKSDTEVTIRTDFDSTPMPLLFVHDNEENEAFTQEFQLIGSAMNRRLNYTLGAFYFENDRRYSQPLEIGNLPLDTSNGVSVYDIVSTAFYGQVSYDITEKLNAAVGIRYTNDDFSATVEGAFNSVTMAPETFNDVSEEFTDTSPYFGINYQATDDVFLYGKVSKGFRAGGFTLNKAFITDPAVLALGAPFDPEIAWTYEIGARIEAFDGRLRFNPTIFQTDWEDLQFLQPVEVPNIITTNAGDAQITGLEIESEFAATDKLLIRGSLSLLDAEYTRLDPNIRVTFPGGFITNPGNIPGLPSFFAGGPPILPVGAPTIRDYVSNDTPLARTPEVKYTIGARYTQPLSNGGEVIINSDYAWTDEQQGIAEGIAPLMPSFGLLNGRIQYNSPNGNWGVGVFGNNLTDEYFELSATAYDIGLSVGPRLVEPGRPRTYGVELSVNF